MPGIRVKGIPRKCTDRDLKIYFSKPENGGGLVERIYYPLFNNDAVIIFEDPETVTTVLAKEEHDILRKEIDIELLPSLEAFTLIEAKLDPSVAALIQATDEIKDEIQYHMTVEFIYDKTRCLTGVRGDWFMLECLWARIDQVSKRQGRVRHRHNQLKSHKHRQDEETSSYPMEVDDQVISMPSRSDKASVTEEHSSEEDYKKKELANVHTEPKTKASKKTITAFTDKKFGKIERFEKKDISTEELDNSIEQLASLAIAESAISDSGRKETKSKDTDSKTSERKTSERNENDIVILSNKPDDVRSLDFRYGPLNVSVYTGWITMAETDAIVNAANGSLAHYGGVADAILKAAGREMERQCEEYVRKSGSVPTTGAMHTCAGGEISEKVKYIIHAVGPMWSSLYEHKCAVELTETFLNCMMYGNDVLKIHSITMPVISSGVFGCPLELCIRSFLNAVLLFASEHMFDSIHLKEVNLVNNNSDNTAMTVMQLRDLISHGAQVLLHEAQQQINQTDDYEAIMIPGQRLALDRDTDYIRPGSDRPERDRAGLDHLTRTYTVPYKPEMYPSSRYGTEKSLVTDSRSTRGEISPHVYDNSTKTHINYTNRTSKDIVPYMNFDKKSFDLSIRNQDLIGASESSELPFRSNLPPGISGNRADDVNVDAMVSCVGIAKRDRSSRTGMPAPPTKSYRTEESRLGDRSATSRVDDFNGSRPLPSRPGAKK